MGQKVNPLGFRLGYSQKYHADWFAFPQNYSKTLYQDLQIRKYLNKEFPDTESGIANILIKRTTHKFYLQIHTARPRLFLDSEDSVKKNEEMEEKHEEIKENIEKEKTKKEKEIEEEIEKILELYDIENPIELDKIFSKQKILNSKECPKGLVNLRRYIEKLLLNQILLKLSLLEERKPDSNVSLLAASLAYQLEKRVAFRRAVKQTIKRAQAEPKVLGIKVQVSGRLNGAEIARSEWVREGRVPLHTLRAEVGYATHKAKTLYGILGIKIWLYKEAKNVYFRKIIVKSKDDILINLNKYTPEEKQKINKKPHFEEKKFTIPVLLAKPKRNQ